MSKKTQNTPEQQNQEEVLAEADKKSNQAQSSAEVREEPKEENVVEDLNKKILSLAAEIENTRRRSEQQITDLKKYAIKDFAKDIINVLENFYLIIDNAPEEELLADEKLKNFFEGVKLTHSDLLKLFEKNNIKRIYPKGEKFDHNLHQVISQIDSEEESGTVMQVVQSGYMLNDRLIKEAMVVVSK